MKKLLCLVLAIATCLALCVPAMAEDKPVTLKIIASQPEYQAVEEEIWKLYTEEHPNVTIEMSSINEDTTAAFKTQVAAGDAPDLWLYAVIEKSELDTYVNLSTIDYPYWDLLPYDARGVYGLANGTEANYAPVLYPFSGVTFSFIYHADIMEQAGLDPRGTIRSMDDLDAFLAELKTYADANGYACTLDMGWHNWCVFDQEIYELAIALGASADDMTKLWLDREIAWTDIENNPYVPAFEKLKEWYDAGYLPEKWWTRSWETDFEAGFTAKNSILCYHGPWLWTKVETADPDAKLSGFPFPANANGIIQNGAIEPSKGTAMFVCNKDNENWDTAVDAFNWWNSPEIVKLRAEAFGNVPLMDLSSVGAAELDASQYNEVIKPIQEGFFGEGVIFDSNLWISTLAGAYKNKDGQPVLQADDMAVNYGDYFEGKISIEDLMAICQTRFETYYTFD